MLNKKLPQWQLAKAITRILSCFKISMPEVNNGRFVKIDP